jgi:phosphoglycerate dehydrogenase-like enzyme
MNVVYCGGGWFPILDFLRAALPDWAQLRRRNRELPLSEDLRAAHVILPSNCPIDGATIRACPSLRLIQQPAVGVDGIDLEAARQRGIPVCNVPGANGQSVAEQALLLLLMLARRVPAARRAFANAEIGAPVGNELFGKTLGLVGTGASGSRLSTMAAAIGMPVVAVNSRSSDGDWQSLFAASDFISVHCPLNAATRGLLGREAFSRMKRGVFIINCARGEIIDRAALIAALDAGIVAGVGLDTFWQEPWDPADPLFQRDTVVTMPHLGGSTAEAFTRLAAAVADNLRRLHTGEPLRNRIA